MDRDQAVQFMHNLLRAMLSKKASDVHSSPPVSAAFKVDGKMTPVSNQTLTPQHAADLARAMMNDKQAAEFEQTKECNFAVAPAGIGRFRVDAFVRAGACRDGDAHDHSHHSENGRSQVAASAQRRSDEQARSYHVRWRDGLRQIDVAGGDDRLSKRKQLWSHCHHRGPGRVCPRAQNCLITQREVGVDTDSWHVALKNTLRQAPDVILIGEVRDRDTMDHAIAFAETGHLAMGTLHANSANQALDRIINFFPEDRKAQLLMDLSLNMRAIVSQRLVPMKDGKGRRAAIEILLNSPLISDLIFKGEVHEIKAIMAKSRELGMQTFDQALFDLYEAGEISYEDALRNAVFCE